MENELKGNDWNIYGYDSMTTWFMPGAFEQFGFYEQFIHMIRENPKILKDNVQITTVFGSPTCIWNGGRSLHNVYLDRDNLEHIRDFYMAHNITVRFVFTNPLLKEEDVYDRYGNMLLDMWQYCGAEILVNSPILKKYIEDKYPRKFKFISSTTKRLTKPEDQLKEFDEDYHMIVLDFDYNHDWDFLEQIKEEDRDKVEILVNSICPHGCKARLLHQKFSASQQLKFDSDHRMNDTSEYAKQCPLAHKAMRLSTEVDLGYTNKYLEDTNYIKNYEINDYISKGFHNFKLQGREFDAKMISGDLLPFMIRPTHYHTVISNMQMAYRNF